MSKTSMAGQLNEVYAKLAGKMMDEYFDKYGYETVRVVPRSRFRQLKQFLRLEPKKYRNVAQKGYRMSKDWVGMPVQVPKETPKATDKGNTITIHRYAAKPTAGATPLQEEKP